MTQHTKKQLVTNILMLIFILLFFPSFVFSQQLTQFSLYSFNNLHINPGYAGYKNQHYVQTAQRNQWSAFPGAPKSFSFSADLSLNERKSGVGFSFLSDEIGPTESNSFLGTYAHRIKTSKYSFFGLGMTAGATHYSINGKLLKKNDPIDPLVPDGMISKFVPNLNIGLFFNTDEFYFGASVFNLIGKSLLNRNEFAFIPHDRHYFITIGGILDLTTMTKFKPSLLIKHTKGSPTSIDLSTSFLLSKKMWIGSSIRTNMRIFPDLLQSRKELNSKTALIGFVEYNITPQFRLAYAYDFNLNVLTEFGFNSHEFSMGIFINKKDRPVSQLTCYF